MSEWFLVGVSRGRVEGTAVLQTTEWQSGSSMIMPWPTYVHSLTSPSRASWGQHAQLKLSCLKQRVTNWLQLNMWLLSK